MLTAGTAGTAYSQTITASGAENFVHIQQDLGNITHGLDALFGRCSIRHTHGFGHIHVYRDGNGFVRVAPGTQNYSA